MGNALTCLEKGSWDHCAEIKEHYSLPPVENEEAAMGRPITEYFISAGHNSYLTGNQLVISAGTSTIQKCLEEGCRVIELDVYNSPQDKEEPICKHGPVSGTVTFRECVQAIAKFAFVKSPYPVILTLENHTDYENQAYLAKILIAELGAKLFIPGPKDVDPAQYRTPLELKHKVLCRTSFKAKHGAPHEDFKQLIYIVNSKFKGYAQMVALDHATSSSFAEGVLPKIKELNEKAVADDAKQPLAPKNADSTHPSGRASLRTQDTIDEDQEAGASAEAGSLQEMYLYTSRHLMRVYPAGHRISSSNFDPMHAWIRGASLAAMNWQTWDKPLWVAEGLFRANGGTGYVPKPLLMVEPESSLPDRSPRTLEVVVYAAFKHQGRNFCCFKDDLYVQAEIAGMPKDEATVATTPIQNSGRLVCNKTWCFKVYYPEIAVLLLGLMDQDAGTGQLGKLDYDCLGYYSLPLASLVEGSYKLHLRNPHSCGDLPADDIWIKVSLRWVNTVTNPNYTGPA